jgi:hypothetical protein
LLPEVDETPKAIYGPLRTSKEFQETLLSLPAWQEPIIHDDRRRDRLVQAEFRFSVDFTSSNSEIASISSIRSQISVDQHETYMPLVLMLKQEVEKIDGHQYNYHLRKIYKNEESISILYICSLSLEAGDRHKSFKSEDSTIHRLSSVFSFPLLLKFYLHLASRF